MLPSGIVHRAQSLRLSSPPRSHQPRTEGRTESACCWPDIANPGVRADSQRHRRSAGERKVMPEIVADAGNDPRSSRFCRQPSSSTSASRGLPATCRATTTCGHGLDRGPAFRPGQPCRVSAIGYRQSYRNDERGMCGSPSIICFRVCHARIGLCRDPLNTLDGLFAARTIFRARLPIHVPARPYRGSRRASPR